MIDIETLSLVADWRESLSARLARARLKFELVGAGREEVIALGAEVREFSALCEVLKQVTGNEDKQDGDPEANTPRQPPHIISR